MAGTGWERGGANEDDEGQVCRKKQLVSGKIKSHVSKIQQSKAKQTKKTKILPKVGRKEKIYRVTYFFDY